MHIVRVLLLFIFLLPCVSHASDITKHYLKELPLSTALKETVFVESPDAQYEYIAAGNTLVLNYLDLQSEASSIEISDPAISGQYNILSEPPAWKFYKPDGGYSDKSGAMALHNLQIRLPDCSYGNVWKLGGNFSAVIPNVEPTRRHEMVFSVNGQDVSTLFHYDEKKQAFAVKEFYQKQFAGYFANKDAMFAWSLKGSDVAGNVRIVIGNKRIRGTVSDLDGKNLAFFVGKELKLRFAGSDKLIPHEISTKIDRNGAYSIDGLASFEYSFSIDGIPSVPALKSLNQGTLTLAHIAPVYDMLLSSSKARPYSPGELLILVPVALDARLTGDIGNFKQLAGDPAEFSVVNNVIVMLLPVKRALPEDLIFQMQVGDKRILLKIQHPVRVDDGYEQFGLFDSEGLYAKTSIIKLDEGGVLPLASDLMPVSSINTMSRIMQNAVKVHYYHGKTHRAADITDLFIWSDSQQAMVGDEAKHNRLYGLLSNDPGTIAFTFCADSQEKQCFRAKHVIRQGGTGLNVTLSGWDAARLTGKQLILKELHITDNTVVRSAKLDETGKALFTAIPSGRYLLYLADTSLVYYANAVVNITAEDNSMELVKELSIAVKRLPAKVGNIQLERLMNGNVLRLSPEPIIVRHNDYSLIDLKQLDPQIKTAISELNVLGNIPGRYILYPDNTIALFTDDIPMDSLVTIVFKSGDILYQLPLYFKSSNYSIVTEKGLDYTMCPEERNLCTNAFVDVKGVSQGIYNGRTPLSITLPVSFQENEIHVYMNQNIEITDIFRITASRRQLTLRSERIAGFLSTLRTGDGPITLKLKDRTYYITLIPGYKSLEASVVDESGSQSSFFSGLSAILSCQYAPDRYYSQIGTIKGASLLSFDNLPNCNYELTVLDRDRLFYGYMNNLDLSAGQNTLRTVFPVKCAGSNSALVENCQPLLPILQDRRMIAPDFAMLLSNSTDRVSVEPAGLLQYATFNQGAVFFAQTDSVGAVKIKLSGAERDSELTIRVDKLADHMQQVVARPPSSASQPLSIDGLTSSYVYHGDEPLKFRMRSAISYNAADIKVRIAENDITDMFIWHATSAELVLKAEEIENFIDILDGRQKTLNISFAERQPERHYRFAVVIGAGVADISGEVVSAEPDGSAGEQLKLSANAKALIVGTKGKNGHEFRQLIDVKASSFVFSNIPLGLYDLLVFDMQSGFYGKREISVDMRHADVVIDIPVRKIQ